MKPIIKNFLGIIRRFKMAVTLNILGLAIAFAAFMVIMAQLDYDYGFDKFHKDHDKIFRVEWVLNNGPQTILNRPLAEAFFESSPHIVAGTITESWTGIARFNIEGNDERNVFEENSIVVAPTFFDVFTFDFIEGSTDGYIAPGNVFIPLSLSQKLFGNGPAVGKTIMHYGWGEQTIMAVYRDFPENSIVGNNMYFAMGDNDNKDNWSSNSYNAYIRVNDAANVPALFDNFKRNYDASAIEAEGRNFGWDSRTPLRFTALKDIHYVTDVRFDNTPKASKQMLMVLFAIAIAIVVIASINFTNFNTALTPMRIKSVNTQRVLGASRISLRLSIASETVIISLLAYLLSLLLVLVFNTTSMVQLIDADLSFAANPLIFGGTALIALFAGAIAGAYPAFYITSFAPALVLKGSFGLSPKGKQLRNTLIGVQFIASFALIIGASFMYLQNYFMQNSPLGYDKDAVITVNIGAIQGSREAFINNLKSYAGIEDVTYGESLLSSADQYREWGRPYKGRNISFESLPVHYSFMKVMGIEVTEGRHFRAEDANLEQGVFVFNEAARKKFDLELNTTIGNQGEIIGFMPDIKFASFRNAVEPMAFYVWGTENWGDRSNMTYIKVIAGADKRAAMSHVRSTFSEFYSGDVPPVIRFYDEILQNLYEKEIAINSLITLFSIIAIFISIVGVFGLVLFDSESKRKEIGVRKVHGASTISIIAMFNKGYFKILAICFVIAAPLSWHAVTLWLENFAYQTPMYWWVYLVAFVIVGMITCTTVTFQNWRVANDNPIKAIKSE